jgi:NLE (NUC135) domain
MFMLTAQQRIRCLASAGTQLQLPHQTTPQQLETLVNGLLKNEEKVPYAFYLEDAELSGEIGMAMLAQNISVEKVVSILYRPQAIFRVRPVGRCSATMSGALLWFKFVCMCAASNMWIQFLLSS